MGPIGDFHLVTGKSQFEGTGVGKDKSYIVHAVLILVPLIT